jgi:hypothetical protein
MNYPLGVNDSHFDEDTCSTYILTIDDVLAHQYVRVRGVEFDTHATASLSRVGEDGEIVVNELEIRSVFLVVTPDDSRIPTPFLIDKNRYEFPKGWMDALVKEVERIAIIKAKSSGAWERLDSLDD